MIDMQNDPCEKHKTNYEIVQEGTLFSVYLEGTMACKGFFDEESALHAVWVQNGKKEDNYYTLEGGAVYCYVRLEATA